MQVSAGSKPIFGIAAGVVGAIVGMFVGNPMMGFKLGMMAGSFLFVPKAESQVNRVAPSDIQIPTCEVGNPIPVFFGTFGPVSGNVIYFGNKVKIRHTSTVEVGGKGGGQTTTNVWFTWEVDFMISLGWGPGTVLRAYAGGKEIKLDKFRILDGTQTTSDAVFSTKARKPVYKGLILVAASSYDLGQSGQFPLFQFEVARKFPVDDIGTYHWTTATTIPVAGGIDSLGDEVYLGGGSTTALPQVDIYDAWLKKDDTVPGTIPAAAKRIAVADNFVFLVEWTTNPMKVYKYTRSTMAYVATLDLTGTANKIFAISCDEYRLFVCYNNASNEVRIGEYRTSTMALENTRTITGITAGQEITDIDVDPLYFYVTDTAAAKVWQILRSSLAATSRTIASGTPNGLDIDNNGNVWVANSSTSVYQYSPAWALLATITNTSFGNSSGVAIMPNKHKVAVLAKAGDVGTVVCVSSGELTTAVEVDFEYERTWKIAATTTDILKLAASASILAVLEDPSDDIFLYGPTGYYRNTITGTFLDVDVNELGVYAIPDSSNNVNFYADGEGSADTRTVSTDVAGDSALNALYSITFGDTKLVAAGKESFDGDNMLYVVWNNTQADRYFTYFVSCYTLATNGNVSTATYERTIPINAATASTPKALRASNMGYGLFFTLDAGGIFKWSATALTWQRIITSDYRLNAIDWTSDSDRIIGCAEGYGAVDPTVWVFSKDGVPQKNHTDTSRLTFPSACAYYDGRIYVGDKVTGAGNTRILSYICEASPLSSVGEVLPADVGYELLTNTTYGAGLDPALIDTDLSKRANSFCFEHGISIMPMYTAQMTVADLLEDLCAHHNGFISVAGGKISHRQFVYDPFDDDCAFTEITAKSDAFGDGAIGSQWDISGPIGPNLVTNGGFEDGVTGWGAFQGNLAAISNGLFGKCIELTATSGANQNVIQTDIPLTIGKRYRLTYHHKSGSAGVQGNYIGFYNGSWQIFSPVVASSDDWQKNFVDWTSTVTQDNVYIIKNSTALGTILFDEVSVQEIPNIVEAGGLLTITNILTGTVIGVMQTEICYGAFDIQVDFSSFSVTPSSANQGRAGIEFYIDDNNAVYVYRIKNNSIDGYNAAILIDGVGDFAYSGAIADAAGSLRIVRKGQTVYCYYDASGVWTLLASWSGFSAIGGRPRLWTWAQDSSLTVVCAFDNYKHYESLDAIYPEHIITEVTDAEGGKSVKDDAVVISNTGNRDRINQVNIEYSRRSLTTGPAGPAKASDFVDIAENGLNATTLRLAGFRRLSPATFMAYMYLKRALAMTESLSLELGWKNNNLKAGDLAWITYPLKALDHAPIRIASMEVTPQGTHKVTAIREDDIYDVDIYADDIMIAPTEPPPNVDPGDVSNIRLILMPAELSAPLDYDLDIFFSPPPNESWSGASIYQAYAEDGDYVRKGTTSAGGVLGTVAAVGDSAGTKYIDVRLDGDDTLSSLVALPSYFQNLAWVECLTPAPDEIHYIQFETVTLQSLTTWRLTGLTYDTIKVPVDNSYGAIAAGDAMVFYAQRPFTLDIPDADLGVPLWFKVLSVNQAGQEQSLADVTAETVTVAARNTIPVIGDYTEGTPAALVGDAVHYEASDDSYYRANPLTRANVVGIKDGAGNIITTGPARILPTITPASQYYLKCPPVDTLDYSTGIDNSWNEVISNSYQQEAQSFTVPAGGQVPLDVTIYMSQITAGGATFNVCCEIRTDDGTGKPSSTVLARSEWIRGDDVVGENASPPIYRDNLALCFRFFEYVALAASTTYHLVIRPDLAFPPVWSSWGLRVWGKSNLNAGTRSYYNGSTWSSGSPNDIAFTMHLADTLDTSAANITTTHPFDTATWSPVVGYLPIQRVGLATSASEMLVAIDRSWPVVEFQDWKTTYSGIDMHNVATLDLIGADKILLLYHFWATTYGDNTQAQAYLNDIAGTLYEFDNDIAPFQQMIRAQVWNKSDLLLSSRKYVYLDLGTAGTPKAGRITILKESIAGVPPNIIPQEVLVPVGGTAGQMLAKVSATDHDLEWGDVTIPSSYLTFVVGCAQQTPTNGDTVYFGSVFSLAPSTTAQRASIYIPQAGVIRAAYINWYAVSTAGTNENVSMYIRLNNTTDTLIETIGSTDAQKIFNKADLAITVAAGDLIEIKLVCPTWATRPTNVNMGGEITMEVT